MSKILLLGVKFIYTGKLDIFECKLLLFTRRNSLNGFVSVPLAFICHCNITYLYTPHTYYQNHGLYHHVCHSYFISTYLCTYCSKRAVYSYKCMLSTSLTTSTLHRYCPRPLINGTDVTCKYYVVVFLEGGGDL